MMYNNRPYRTRREIFLSYLLQGLVLSQLSTQLFASLLDCGNAVASFCGVTVCVLYTLCKLLWENADEQDIYLNDDRITGIITGCLIGECILIL